MSTSPGTGQRFGPYEIQSRLGGGGMGAVFRAWDARLHREVAIKLLHDEYAIPGMRERFLREARAASALNHPNICTIFDIGEQNGDPYLVMELLEGETLRDRIAQRSLSIEEMVCIAKEAAEALGAAHAKGVVHRDIKPANIFLMQRPNGNLQAKVLDFGLAKIEGGVLGARQGRSMDLTTAGSTVGTLAYMSPEQARGEVLDSRSDLFSLGVVLYEMATRHVPFPGATSALVFVKLLNQAPEPVRDWNEAVPRDLEKVIFKLMAKERTARYQTAQELLSALDQVNEKGGSWLRKAAAVVPLVRAPDPAARNKRLGSRATQRSEGEEPTQAFPAEPSAAPAPASASAGEAPHFLRPVVRMPRGDVSPRPSTSISAILDSNTTGFPQRAKPTIQAVQPVESAAVAEPLPVPLPPKAAPSDPVVETTLPIRGPVAGPVDPPVASPSPAQLERAPDALPLSAEPAESNALSVVRKPLKRWILFGLGAAILLTSLAAASYRRTHGHFGAALLTASDAVVVTTVENRTSDRSLDGTIAQALAFSLQQSPYLHLRDPESLDTAQHQRTLEGETTEGAIAAHDLAKRLKTKAYLYGSIKGSAAPYLLHLDLLDTATGDLLTSAEASVSSAGEMPAAVDRLAVTLRSAVGEDGDSLAHASGTLKRTATTNLGALHAYFQGDVAQGAGQTLEALRCYQQAAALDPHFAQAQLRLVTVYRSLRAGQAAADAAKQALSATANATERMRVLPQAEFDMEVNGDLVHATAVLRHGLASAPQDAQLLAALARSLRLQGHLTEALQTSQQSLEEDAYALEGYDEAEHALIGLDRYDAAYQLLGQVEKLGAQRHGETLTAAYLGNRTSAVASARAAFDSEPAGYRSDWGYGVYLDNTGKLAAGRALWHGRAMLATQIPALDSASAFLLSQGALDQALAGNCESGQALAHQAETHQAGQNTIFNLGMTSALCGNLEKAETAIATLQTLYPKSFAVCGFYVADLKAAVALHRGDPAAALELLKPARQYDLISLTPYLRGLAHVALHQVQVGIVDFQTVLAHRGIALLVGNTVYPMAEIGVARAFADTGDLGNSAAAYRRFLELWQNADAGQPLVVEARAHTR